MQRASGKLPLLYILTLNPTYPSWWNSVKGEVWTTIAVFPRQEIILHLHSFSFWSEEIPHLHMLSVGPSSKGV